MAMVTGSVIIDDSGAATTNTGMAAAVYAALLNLPTYLHPAGVAITSVAEKRAMAALARAIATGIVPYVQANATAVIPATAAGDALQQAGGVDTTRPTVQKTLAIT